VSPVHALIWFVGTTLGVLGVIGLGTYLAMRTYGNRDVDDRRHATPGQHA
jgi:hypothetical protein